MEKRIIKDTFLHDLPDFVEKLHKYNPLEINHYAIFEASQEASIFAKPSSGRIWGLRSRMPAQS